MTVKYLVIFAYPCDIVFGPVRNGPRGLLFAFDNSLESLKHFITKDIDLPMVSVLKTINWDKI